MRDGGLEIRPYSSAIGAEIAGVDLSKPLVSEARDAIYRALLDYHVVFFRDQELTPSVQISFSRQFGELEPYPFADGMEGYPEVVEIVKLPDEKHNFGSGWHVDMSFNTPPPGGAALYAIEVPPAGGDTLFANMTLAYETLSDGFKAALERVRGVHDSHLRRAYAGPIKGMKMRVEGSEPKRGVQRLTRTHPDTGRTSLFISPDYCAQLEDMTVEESATLLEYLESHATRHEFICRFRWTPGAVAMWDNRCTMHRAIEDDLGARSGQGFRRVLRRTTFKRFFGLAPAEAAAR